MDFALAHNVRGVTLTRRERQKREKGLNHRTVKSSQRQDTHNTVRERGEREGETDSPSTLSRGQGQAVCLCSQRCLWFVPRSKWGRAEGVAKGERRRGGRVECQDVALGIRASFGHSACACAWAFSHLSFVILIIPFYYLHHYQRTICPAIYTRSVCQPVCMYIYIYISPLIIRHL